MTSDRSAFSLLEVVVALAMLAVIAIPAIGLATMAVGRSKAQLVTSNASELKTRIDMALRAYGIDSLPNDDSLSFLASEDLLYIEESTAEGGADTKNDQYYLVNVRNPEGYEYNANDSFRLVVYEVIWPNNDVAAKRKKLFFTSVFRK